MVKTATALRSGDYHSIFIIYYLMPFQSFSIAISYEPSKSTFEGERGYLFQFRASVLIPRTGLRPQAWRKDWGKALEPFYDMGQAQSAPMRALRVAL